MILFQKSYMKELIFLKNNNFSRLLQTFLTTYIINDCGFSKNTKSSYSTTFLLLIEFLNNKYKIKPNDITFNDITNQRITEFLNYLETERKISASTRNQRLAAIKSFYKYVQKKEPALINTCSEILMIKVKKVPKITISYFTEKEIKILIDYLISSKNLKYLCIISTLYETGARVQELIDLKSKDIKFADKASIILHGKGNKKRVVPISKELVKLLNIYINKYPPLEDDILFRTKNNTFYSDDGINYIINKTISHLKDNNPDLFKERYSAHSFRHSKATHLYNNGTPLLYIKNFLGHESVISTEIYAKPDSEIQRKQLLNNSTEIKVSEKYSASKKEGLDDWLKQNKK